MTAPTILIVEDEPHIAAGLKLNLELEGYRVRVAIDGREARAQLAEPHAISAIILDVMLPDANGFELCEALRSAGDFTPVLMLTARADPADRVRGLEAGADDYLPKPFDLDELLARVRSLLRRQRWARPSDGPSDRLTFGDAVIDFERHTATARGEPVKLTQLELDLLRYFNARAGLVVSRRELLADVWHLANHPNTRVVDNFVARLRKHFERDTANPRHFISVRGAGYKFVPDP